MMETSTWYFEDVFPDDTSFSDFLSDFNISLPSIFNATQLYNLFLNKYGLALRNR